MEENFSGELTQEVDDGKVVITFVDGKKEGPTRFITNDGVVLSEIPYKEDLISGVLKQYYPNGSLLSTMEYLNGAPNGEFVSYFENGMKQVVATYKDSKMEGEFKAFDEFGDLLMSCVYLNGEKHGKSLLYYPKSQGGNVYEVSFYENGLLNGDKVTFYDSGEVMSITPYKDGRAQSYTKNYTNTGEELSPRNQ